MGRPTKYDGKKHPELAFWMAQAGLTDIQIAKELHIAEKTLYTWKKEHPGFLQAIKRGKQTPDEEVEAALLRKAKGFKYTAGREEKVALPDTLACIFWLKNRRPNLWRDRREHEHTGKEGGPIVIIRRNSRDAGSG